MAFRASAKLNKDITMLVNVQGFLKTRFGGLRVKINGQIIITKVQGPKLQL
ncbi:hypothetical protein HanXRQr2_Chr01g0040551 [Helianthus annuus]|uniref:Uncharacterized protein n=1 Tax=Helianthus annuus TaxID=4232 RepID=A0A9K3JZ21_HELAN|nr:hypothetical protein HanXRQr2_Chr01g0040551 [Helianthus annuus]